MPFTRYSLSTSLSLTTLFVALLLAISLTTQADQLAAAPQKPSTAQAFTIPEHVTFNAHIRPIMSNTCFTCHGPDEEDNPSELRLDKPETAYAAIPSDDELVAIKPGVPAESAIYVRITADDPDMQMPPGDFRHQLTPREKALFKRWIEQGAKYEDHWAYAPLTRPELPEIGPVYGDLAFNKVDRFILARLEAEGIAPTREATRAEQLRRLSLDLIGLPPTPDELQAYLADEAHDDEAYERQVDRLLASRHYGERMAISWLDIIRFADTVGYHGDQNQRNFPYRDYVIDAFNSNKPFDEFTREQLAGDLLQDSEGNGPTPEQLTATGLMRLNMVTREGGAQPKEYLAKYAADRVRMMGTAWLGATLACCECHNHKYDPYSAQDFYSMAAFFNDIRQWGVYSDYGYTPNPDLRGFNNNFPFPPEMRVRSESQRQTILNLEEQVARFLSEQAFAKQVDPTKLKQWIEDVGQLLGQHPDGWQPAEIQNFEGDRGTAHQLLDDGSVLLTGKPLNQEAFTLQLAATLGQQQTLPTTLPIVAIRLEVLPDAAHGGHVGRGADGKFQLSVKAELVKADSAQTKEVSTAARYLRIDLPGNDRILSLAEVQAFTKDDTGKLVNVAKGARARQSSNHVTGPASNAVDGNTNGNYAAAKSTSHTQSQYDPWWEVDLGKEVQLEKLAVWNRLELPERLKGYRVTLLDANRKAVWTTKPQWSAKTSTVKVPLTSISNSNTPLDFLYSIADRWTPRGYRNGQAEAKLDKTWRSGPAQWQLPSNEASLAHTAVYQLASPLRLQPGEQLQVRIVSGNVGRVRFSLTPLTRAVAGWPAASDALRDAVQTSAEGEPLTAEQKAVLVAGYVSSTRKMNDLGSEANALLTRILEARSGWAMTLVTQQAEKDKRRVGRVLPRGNWQDESGELVTPSVPHFLPQPKAAGERQLNRLDLANWLTSDDNPMVARHFANRTWQQFFGAGLSGVLDDLGNQGEWPSHPLLLDWLAVEFRESGWDVKALVRKIVLSRTYRQQAAVRDDLGDIDPYNRLLAQQSARRLEAEIVRDNALAIAGLLNTDLVGGPSAFPYQPAGHYSNLQFPSRGYQASRGDNQYRRGIYMHWQRTFLHPMLVNFDAPSRDECVAQRSLSNSPQQALTLLNDPTFVEASRALAAKLMADHPDSDFGERLDMAFLRAVSRPASKAERQALRKLYDDQLEYFKAHPEDAEQLDREGYYRLDKSFPAAELAAWTQVCRVVINLQETITRY